MVWAHNTTESQATGMTPYTLVFGRTPMAPADIGIPEPFNNLGKTQKEHFAEIMSRQEVAHTYATKMQALYSAKMKERFDRTKATNIKLEPGDTVFIQLSSYRFRKTKKKMRPKYAGPFCIVRFTSRFTVKLKNLTTGKTCTQAVHIARLKRGRVRKEDNTWDPVTVIEEVSESEEDLSTPIQVDEDVIPTPDCTNSNTPIQIPQITSPIPSTQPLAITDSPSLTQQRTEAIKSRPTVALTRAGKRAIDINSETIQQTTPMGGIGKKNTVKRLQKTPPPSLVNPRKSTRLAKKTPTKWDEVLKKGTK